MDTHNIVATSRDFPRERFATLCSQLFAYCYILFAICLPQKADSMLIAAVLCRVPHQRPSNIIQRSEDVQPAVARHDIDMTLI